MQVQPRNRRPGGNAIGRSCAARPISEDGASCNYVSRKPDLQNLADVAEVMEVGHALGVVMC